MSEITIRIETYSRQPDRERLALADRYVERANQSVDRREREAYAREADRPYREEHP